jgi:hypothetical protein
MTLCSIKLALYSRSLQAQARALFVACVGVLMPALLASQSNAAPKTGTWAGVCTGFANPTPTGMPQMVGPFKLYFQNQPSRASLAKSCADMHGRLSNVHKETSH